VPAREIPACRWRNYGGNILPTRELAGNREGEEGEEGGGETARYDDYTGTAV